ncbi:MAG: MerR family transcriptional regulator [Mycobacteriales bacterium]|nr:MerR family transcriptional regulator [Mycobacteriales bacterium]
MGTTGARADDVPTPDLPEAPLSVAAVAHRLGVAPATLRTWDRRYGLGPTGHAAGAHRRYSPRDVARLQTMRRLTLQGVPPASAAQAALEVEPLVSGRDTAPLPTRDGRLQAPAGGGRVLPLPGAEAAVRGLGRAAMALDGPAVTEAVRAELARRGVTATWDDVLRPVLAAVGARWAATGQGVEVEHLLSDCVTTALREIVPDRQEGARPVLLACAPDDQHALPLHVLGAALAERGHVSRTLGAAMPADALAAAVRRTGPAALFLWSQLASTADPAVLERLPTTRPATAVVVGGPGWVGAELPARVTRADDLKSAVALVEQALGA